MVERAPFPAGEPVSAAEHEQLRRDFAALTEQFEAASAVLEAMGRSASDPDTVLDHHRRERTSAVPRGRVSSVPPGGRRLPADQVGTACPRSPSS